MWNALGGEACGFGQSRAVLRNHGAEFVEKDILTGESGQI